MTTVSDIVYILLKTCIDTLTINDAKHKEEIGTKIEESGNASKWRDVLKVPENDLDYSLDMMLIILEGACLLFFIFHCFVIYFTASRFPVSLSTLDDDNDSNNNNKSSDIYKNRNNSNALNITYYYSLYCLLLLCILCYVGCQLYALAFFIAILLVPLLHMLYPKLVLNAEKVIIAY